jgi:molecular chaperone GrpE
VAREAIMLMFSHGWYLAMQKRSNDNDNERREDIGNAGLEGSPDASSADQRAETVDSVLMANSDVEKLHAQIADKDSEIGELKDKYLRTLAESENIRKRVRQQSEETVRLQRENLLRDLLPIADNLERAVEAARTAGGGKPIVEGVEMVLRSLFDFLKSHGVSQISAIGQPFDPQRHEAVDHVDSGEHPPNTVVSEFHRGYLIGDRMLRPSRVSVARAGAGAGDDSIENR